MASQAFHSRNFIQRLSSFPIIGCSSILNLSYSFLTIILFLLFSAFFMASFAFFVNTETGNQALRMAFYVFHFRISPAVILIPRVGSGSAPHLLYFFLTIFFPFLFSCFPDFFLNIRGILRKKQSEKPSATSGFFFDFFPRLSFFPSLGSWSVLSLSYFYLTIFLPSFSFRRFLLLAFLSICHISFLLSLFPFFLFIWIFLDIRCIQRKKQSE